MLQPAEHRDGNYLTCTGSPRDLLLKEVVGLGGDVVMSLVPVWKMWLH
ncbi:MAG: hypothetical protein HKN10_06745 [Myxococcales bacterium]|nr:hypothetical protein [Myxococcales bacterium]